MGWGGVFCVRQSSSALFDSSVFHVNTFCKPKKNRFSFNRLATLCVLLTVILFLNDRPLKQPLRSLLYIQYVNHVNALPFDP